MSGFIVHSIPGSPFGRSVLATLAEKGAAVRFEAVRPGTLKAQPHLSRHPFGRIPVLEHDGFTLYETQAILRYLDRILPEPALTPSRGQASSSARNACSRSVRRTSPSARPSASATAATRSRFWVRVPVLSVRMRSTAPSVSSAFRRRTSTRRRSRR